MREVTKKEFDNSRVAQLAVKATLPSAREADGLLHARFFDANNALIGHIVRKDPVGRDARFYLA